MMTIMKPGPEDGKGGGLGVPLVPGQCCTPCLGWVPLNSPHRGNAGPWCSSWHGRMAEPCHRDPGEGTLCPCAGRGGPQHHSSLSCSPPASPVPRLDLGKKMSTPQDLMIEELSLRNNRGSQLFQQRQRRMQRFVYEHPGGSREVGLRLTPGSERDSPSPALTAFAGKRFLVGLGVSAETNGERRWLGGLGMETGKHQIQHPPKSKGAGPPLHPVTPLLASCSIQAWVRVAHTSPRQLTWRERQTS